MIRIFPNDDSTLRLIGALLAEQNEVWQERRCLDMDELRSERSKTTTGDGNNIVAIIS